MKVLIQTVGSAGDVHPFIGVGQALAGRGHEVVLFANEMFGDLVQQAGLTFVEMGDAETFRKIVENPDLWDSRKGIEVALRPVVDLLEESIEIIESQLEGASVLVNSTLGFAARVVREIHEVPLVSAHLAPNPFRSNIRLPRSEVMWVQDRSPMWMKRSWWRLIDFLIDRVVAPKLNEVRVQRGLDPVRKVSDEWCIYSPDRTLGLFPDWFGPPQADWKHPVSLTGFPLYDESDRRPRDSDLQLWLSGGDPPVVFTAGSANLYAKSFFETAYSLCTQLDLRAVFATATRADVPDGLPPTLRYEEYVPFGYLLPQSRALISHGGIGTCAQALAAGIPHLVTHVSFDQRDNGSRLTDLGAGDHLPMAKFRGAKAAQALTGLLNGEAGARAHELSTLIDREDALATICNQIEAAART